VNRDDIIRMAKEAGLTLSSFCRWSAYSDDLERFAALVAAAKEQQMIRDGYRKCAEGQRTTQYCGLLDAAVKAERESVGNIILDYAGRDGLSDSDESLLKHLFELIRARGET